ncbi:hypothetical protein M0G43_06000 [Subsaxibacter sp. CAU 1640]|uniref:LVIVD repeat-containing protein n=1 Tax=Subsaxibacter sp. CAU 1640 TaxID=2933271 RepID=UPI0020063E1D|nr:hypothetical protein [Subsaxibacter sp. CAU 1640]MCK7590116.1 hypothetical protein [Subsaxibacter sp. CAU 1640]
MKNYVLFLLIAVAMSCNNDDPEYQTVNVGIPQVVSKSEFRDLIEIQSPKPISQSGKIYAYENYIFVNDKYEGVHVIDNTDPSAPAAVAYIKIPGNEDISVKNNFLYADSAIDLVVFDISDIVNIELVGQLEDVFESYDFRFPENIYSVDYSNYNYETDIIIGWTIEERSIEIVDDYGFETINTGSNDSGGLNSVGTGGSLARFQIVDNYLYTVGTHDMSIFNISNLSEPTFTNTFYSGNNIETMFQADGYLYLGSTDGMYIYSLDNAEAPSYVSEFVHWTGCDPVVVDGDYAYLTLRGGNNCGQQESVLEVIDISDKRYPTLMATHLLENPYGLGFKEDVLFVCDGQAGLKVFDKSNPLNLQWVETFSNVHATDVIPLSNSLLMIGNNVLYQYQYTSNSITLLSTFQL